MYKKSNVIVTGGLGFIGKNFCAFLHDHFQHKVIVDKLTYASDLDFYYNVLRPLGWELFVGDVNDISQLKLPAFVDGGTIINFAAESHVDISFGNAGDFLHSNTSGTLKVIEFCISRNYRLLHVSTDEVYGEITGVGVTEDAPLLPTNPYSATKAAADILVQTYIKCFSLDAKIIRANNIYGSRQLVEKVIPKAIFSAAEKKQFFLHGNKGLSRHFLHTDDLSRALLKIMSTWLSSAEKIFNIRANEEISIQELVKGIYQSMGASEKLIVFGPDRPFNDASYQINDTRLRALGWEPIEKFNVRLQKMCDGLDFFAGR